MLPTSMPLLIDLIELARSRRPGGRLSPPLLAASSSPPPLTPRPTEPHPLPLRLIDFLRLKELVRARMAFALRWPYSGDDRLQSSKAIIFWWRPSIAVTSEEIAVRSEEIAGRSEEAAV